MPEMVSLPIGVLDIGMEYVRPKLGLWLDRMNVVSELFDRYRPWGIKVDDVEIITEGKPSEQGIKFKLSRHRASFFMGPSQCRFSQDDADWQTAEETMQLISIGLVTLTELANVEIATFKTSIAIHLQPKVVPFIELLRPFAASQLAALDDSPLTAFATVLKWSGRRVTIDGSAQIANGVFLRSERDFPGYKQLPEIAAQLKSDEDELFALLDVEEAD